MHRFASVLGLAALGSGLLAAVVASGASRTAYATAAAIVQTAQRTCLPTPSVPVTFSKKVRAGDTLVLVAAGQGYLSQSPVVTAVSDSVNGAWAPLQNTGALSSDGGRHYLSYSVYAVRAARAAAAGLKVTITERAGQSSASAVALEVAGRLNDSSFRRTVQSASFAGVASAPSGAANALNIGLFGVYKHDQPIAHGVGWTLDAEANNCTVALAESAIPGSVAAPTVRVSAGDHYLAGTLTFRVGSTTSPTTTITSSTTHTTTSTTHTTTTALPPSGSAVRFSTGFYPAWETALALARIPFKALTEVNLFSDTTQATAPFLKTHTHGMTASLQHQFVSTVHAHGRLANLTIGGDDDQSWSTACNAANRSTFVSTVLGQVRAYGYDGVDLDIEQGPFIGTADFKACIRTFNAALKSAVTKAGKVPLLTYDSDPSWQGHYMAAIAPYLDQMNLMAYGATCANNCAAVAAEIAANVGVRKSMLAIGIGLGAGMPDATNPADCAAQARYAANHGVGVMVWTIQLDAMNNRGQTPCLNNLAPYVPPG